MNELLEVLKRLKLALSPSDVADETLMDLLRIIDGPWIVRRFRTKDGFFKFFRSCSWDGIARLLQELAVEAAIHESNVRARVEGLKASQIPDQLRELNVQARAYGIDTPPDPDMVDADPPHSGEVN